MEMTVREAVFDFLRQIKVNKVFGNPGSTELGFLANFPDDFQYVLGLQESVALGMADGYAQATQNAGFVSLHSAAGVGHAMGGIFTAFKNQTPLVLIAGQQSRSLLPHMPFLFSNEATELPKPYVKWSVEPAAPEDVPKAIARAYYVAMTEPRGPVLVSVCADDWSVPSERVVAREVSQLVAPDPALLDAVHAQLGRAKHPAIVVGGGVDRAGAWDAVVQLAEFYQSDVLESSREGRRSFPSNHPLYRGLLPAERPTILKALGPYDFVLVLGAPAFPYHTPGDGLAVPEGCTLMQIIDDPEVAAAAVTGTSIVGNVRLGTEQLLARAQASGARRPARAPTTAAPAKAVPAGLNPERVLQTLERLRSPRSILVEEATSARRALNDFMHITRTGSYFTTASGGLGFGLAAAVGVALGHPGEQVIGVLGDGASMYSIQGMWTAAQLKLPVTFIVFVNRSYAILRRFGPMYGLSEPITFPGLDVGGIQFAELGRSLGCAAERIETPDTLEAAMQAALERQGPTVLEIVLK